MIRKLFLKFLVLGIIQIPFARSATPKLIVVISVDQLRYDYLVRFREHFGEEGFMYLFNNGANFINATYKHALSMTGPGHAVISTGSYGNQNGIFANNWYDVITKQDVYCVGDRSVDGVGNFSARMSPANLIGSTFGDELRIHSNFHSKVISVSIKDRAAVLLGGKLADGAYWMSDSSFVTSTYYMDDLPDWVSSFNKSELINSYFGRKWKRALPEAVYASMDKDDAPYEGVGNGLGRTFPHTITGDDTSRISSSYYWALLSSPFGNEILSSFAKEAMKAEKLGRRGFTDLVCIGFSSNDYVGHLFGPHSQEAMDITVQTDRILADLFAFIDTEVGLTNCVIVLTSDHGIAPIPEYLLAQNEHTDAGRLMQKTLMNYCTTALIGRFGQLKENQRWLDRITGCNIYLNRDMVRQKKLAIEQVTKALADSLLTMREIAASFTRQEMMALVGSSPIEQRMKRSFHRLRSGDIVYALKPYFIEGYSTTGTTHGSPYDYDAHVPMIIVGTGIRKGTFASEVSPADIAPTLSALLGVEFPAGREGRVLEEALRLP
jgi:predicted AlkP superfamily pyrophosphatase or phosphodiesterase